MSDEKNKQTLGITLTIAGKTYPLTIDRDKEELFRRAEKEINRRVATLESQFVSDSEGYLAIAALQLSLKSVELESGRRLGDDLDVLADLERKIDKHLNRLK